MRIFYKATFILLGLSILSACTTTSSIGGAGKWEKMGISTDGNVTHEMNVSSINKVGDLVTFQDRKTLKDVNKHGSGLPEHKVSINTWEVNCSKKNYRLTNTDLYDSTGRLIFSDSFNSQTVRPISVNKGSAIAKQIESACR